MNHDPLSLLPVLGRSDLPAERAEFAPVRAALAAEDPVRALALLGGSVSQDAAYWRWLGLARLAAGQTADAEWPLRRAAALGDPEGSVAYSQWLLITGQLAEVRRVLPPLSAQLPSGELRRRAQCLYGLALFLGGETGPALDLVGSLCRSAESAQSGEKRRTKGAGCLTSAQVSSAATLAHLWLQLGELARAEALLSRVLLALPPQRERRARIEALSSLALVQARSGQAGAAASSLESSRALLAALPQGAERWALAAHQRAELEVRWLAGERSALSGELLALHDLALQLQDSELCFWTVATRAELLSLQGQPEKALTSLYDLGTRQGLPLRLRAVRGLLMRRQRYDEHALGDLAEACRELGCQHGALRWRAQLYLADLQLRTRQPRAARATLLEVLSHLGSAQDLNLYASDLAEVDELVQRALIEPDVAPLMQGVLARLRAGALPLRDRPERLEVRTLGQIRVSLGDQEVALSQGAVLVLTYLHLHPHTSRNDMRAVLFPDFDRDQTTHFFRTAVRELRAQLGPDILRLDDTLRHPRYQVSGDIELDLDLSELRRCLATSDLTRATVLYRGAFLEGLEPESEWADQVRQELRLAFNLELQGHFNRVRSPGDLERAEQALSGVLALDAEVAAASADLSAAVAAARRTAASPSSS